MKTFSTILILLLAINFRLHAGVDKPLYVHLLSLFDVNQVWLVWHESSQRRSRTLSQDFVTYDYDQAHRGVRYNQRELYFVEQKTNRAGSPEVKPYYYLSAIEERVSPAPHRPIYFQKPKDSLVSFSIGIAPKGYKLLSETIYKLGHNSHPKHRFEQVLRKKDGQLYVRRPGQAFYSGCRGPICPFDGNYTGSNRAFQFNNRRPTVTTSIMTVFTTGNVSSISGKAWDPDIWDQSYNLKYRWVVTSGPSRLGQQLLGWTKIVGSGLTPLPKNKWPGIGGTYRLMLEVSDGEAFVSKTQKVKLPCRRGGPGCHN